MSFTWLRPVTRRQLDIAKPTGKRGRQGARPTPQIEFLEQRCLLTDFRTITGAGNNLANPAWGQAGTNLIRLVRAAYADGFSAPAGANRPNARAISNLLSDQTDPNNSSQDLNIINQKLLTDYIYVFGQFLDHDLDLTLDNSGQSFPIPPGSPGDPMGTEPFIRSQFDPNTGTTNPRQQINAITAWIDGSQIYGSDPARADLLRTHVGGRLKDQSESGESYLPYNNATFFGSAAPLDMANDAQLVPASALYVTGDRRGNENSELLSLQTLFMREHNFIADKIHAAAPNLSDEQVYQQARRLVGAELQIITYNEWLPALLGPGALPAYTGYNPNVNASISNEFSTAMFRFAHSQLDNEIDRLNNDGTEIASDAAGASLDLAQAFFNPTLLSLPSAKDSFSGHMSTSINPILKGAASGIAQEVDLLAVRDIRNLLFGPPGSGGSDLIARDIQRGRDHGLADYNTVRAAYGLPHVTSFAQITSNSSIQQKLRQLYGTVDNIDVFVGALAEDHAPGADVGPLTKAVLVDQFRRLRDGDRFFYLNLNVSQLSQAEQSALLANASLAKVIQRNTSLTNLQANVFLFTASISGTVFLDSNRNGSRDSGEQGQAGVTVQLLDDSGNVMGTAVTDSSGRYRFTGFNGLTGTGNCTVRLVLPSGLVQTTPKPPNILISNGDTQVGQVDFGVARTGRSPGGGASGDSPSVLMTGHSSPSTELIPGAVDQAMLDVSAPVPVPSVTLSGLPLGEHPLPDQDSETGHTAGATVQQNIRNDADILADTIAGNQAFAQV